MAGGTALVSPSGYFGRQYGSEHHLRWTNQTVAHNTILVDGQGQAPFSHEATGCVLYAGEENGTLTGLQLRNEETGEASRIAVDGAFLAVGLQPENEPFAHLGKLNDWGYFDSAEDCTTQTPGLFVAGDCRSKMIRQVVTAAGDGAVAAMAACRYLD